MAEATLNKDANANTVDITSAAVVAPGEVYQLSDGRAAVRAGLAPNVAGDPLALQTAGQFTVAKTASVVILKGDPIWWDRSANSATPLEAVGDGDFYLGVSLQDAAAADATVVVDLNVEPEYIVDVFRQMSDTVIVAATNAGFVNGIGGHILLGLNVAADAQKVDVLSKHAVPVAVPFIVEGRFAIVTEPDNAVADINIGLASATHATDADAIAEHVLLHFDGHGTAATARKINAQSKDGTTTVTATDTTVVAGANTPVEFRFDCRDLENVKIYINGVRVLAASTFKLDGATGPLKLLAHVEKSGTDDTPGVISVSHLAIRAMDVAN